MDDTVEILYQAIGLVQFDDESFSTLLRAEEVDHLLCSILNLSTEVTTCLTKCIEGVSNMKIGIFSSLTNNSLNGSAVKRDPKQ